MKNFSIILVNYKSLELTKACLDLLRDGMCRWGIPVLVVDNYSADASTEYLRTLDWITLIERERVRAEAGSVAHGRALDLALEQVKTEYVFLLHTDTFVYDLSVFDMMLSQCAGPREVAAVGCVEQLNRGLGRSAWRLVSRCVKHYARRAFQALGIKSKAPKPFMEQHLKSFCALWNVRLVKKHGLQFLMDDRNPGYELQDRMVALGYTIRFISPRTLFGYLDHLQSGTVSAVGGYAGSHRRVKVYNQMVKHAGK
ncbi:MULTISPECIES: glycosyltransferase [unclassified Pseudomonas]|uniref:glycosyltransferase n=1 Tax=unclassified Pseudomonas TaxID=196821 RepID=UPI002AC8E848|nr:MULTISPECIES: glycosyltransferase [unclassified Pseudomonas]MEB0043707.1 glycosyltransferase [Pseudomonas sp. MH10]MEB0121219.1 glycosyltransferase [Pseudomonas sp. CCI1.2]WPX64236.1 glycosyltransferase [Pseudomonas sp. MH10]